MGVWKGHSPSNSIKFVKEKGCLPIQFNQIYGKESARFYSFRSSTKYLEKDYSFSQSSSLSGSSKGDQ